MFYAGKGNKPLVIFHGVPLGRAGKQHRGTVIKTIGLHSLSIQRFRKFKLSLLPLNGIFLGSRFNFAGEAEGEILWLPAKLPDPSGVGKNNKSEFTNFGLSDYKWLLSQGKRKAGDLLDTAVKIRLQA